MGGESEKRDYIAKEGGAHAGKRVRGPDLGKLNVELGKKAMEGAFANLERVDSMQQVETRDQELTKKESRKITKEWPNKRELDSHTIRPGGMVALDGEGVKMRDANGNIVAKLHDGEHFYISAAKPRIEVAGVKFTWVIDDKNRSGYIAERYFNMFNQK